MTARDIRIASAAFLALTVSVGVNLFALQDKDRGSAIETSAIGFTTPPPLPGPSPSSDLGPELSPGTPAMRVAPPASAPATAVAAPSGNSAEIIRGIQRELNGRGYDAGPPDGVVGLITRAAIMAYEHDYGLPLTATPSQDLLSRIVLGSATSSPSRNVADRTATPEADAVIRTVEQQLSALGYTPGKVDGVSNDQLARAIREFEVDQKLPESGRISGPLVSRLTRLQGQGAAGLTSKTKSAQK
ncbi:MAG: peptidoglycan-binding domain-containing protein [Hyphomicrobium sp.]|jgi:peptidoglycan hydrolase-like protein with peptidoglycan-binding domain|nr:peptidoglycan-binding protein [Hyphomicrobium sp.]